MLREITAVNLQEGMYSPGDGKVISVEIFPANSVKNHNPNTMVHGVFLKTGTGEEVPFSCPGNTPFDIRVFGQ